MGSDSFHSDAHRRRFALTVPPKVLVGRMALAGAAVAVVAAAAILIVDARPPAGAPARGPGGSQEPAMKRLENAAGGYSFRYPAEWRARERGQRSRVANPAGDVVVLFDTGPGGRLLSVSGRFLSAMRETYKNVVVDQTRTFRVGSRRAMELRGQAINDAGADVRFVALTVRRGAGGTYVITAFTPATPGRAEGAAVVDEIIGSFRPSTP